MPVKEETYRPGVVAQSIRINEVLEKILSSSSFSSSKQCQHLLRYLVEQSHHQNGESLKERVIGTEVFGRKPDYNTGDDPIVRSRVGEVRKRLAQYYLSDESSDAQLQISIPSGSYRVVYKLRDEARQDRQTVGAEPEVAIQPSDESVSRSNDVVGPSAFSDIQAAGEPERKTQLYIYLLVGAILAILLIAYFGLRERTTSQSALDEFWAPVLHESKPVLIYTGTNAVYAPVWNEQQRARSPKNLLVLPPFLPGETLKSNDVRSINYEYTTVGDLLASVQIASLLGNRHLGYEVRTGENIAVSELRHSPSILIGGANNFWTMEMAHTLPITFIPGIGIQDKSASKTTWTDSFNTDLTDGESYAIAARLLDSETGNPLIIIAGIDSWGTRAAGQFITDPAALKALSSKAPANWSKKNLEVVLHTKVLRRDGGVPTVVTARYW